MNPAPLRRSPARLALTLSVTLAAFLPMMAALGARTGGPGGADGALVVVAAAAYALGVVNVPSRAEGRLGAIALGVLVTGLDGLVLASLGNDPRDEGAWGPVEAGLVAWFATAGLTAPVSTLLRRGAHLDTGDALDRAMLASGWCFALSLARAVAYVEVGRAHRAYEGLVAVALGPGLVATLALGALCALAAMARTARWLRVWRRVLRGEGLRVETVAAWGRDHAVPEARWFDAWGADDDGVLVRHAGGAQGAYRAGEAVSALARVPTDLARVERVLVARLAAACGVLAALVGLAAGPLATLRW